MEGSWREGWTADMEDCQVQGGFKHATFKVFWFIPCPPVKLDFAFQQLLKFDKHCVNRSMGLIRYICWFVLKVTHWPKNDYGKFYTGDSYIILNTYKKDPSSEVSGVFIFVCLRVTIFYSN